MHYKEGFELLVLFKKDWGLTPLRSAFLVITLCMYHGSIQYRAYLTL